MKVSVNNKEVETINASTIKSLLEEFQLPTIGIAVAVDNRLISAAEWSEFRLHENACLVIIKAACGG